MAKRRLVDPVTCEKIYDLDDLEFLNAIERYKREQERPFPTWTEVLWVLKGLGYKKPGKAKKKIRVKLHA